MARLPNGSRSVFAIASMSSGLKMVSWIFAPSNPEVGLATLSRGSFAGRAQELLALVADHPNGLAGVFPGSPHAFTAMLAQRHEGQVHWRTWHAYPQDGQLVATRTRVGARVPVPAKG